LRPSHLPSRARLRSRAAFSLATGLLESGNCAEHLRDQVLYHAELPKPDETTEELVDGNSVGQAKALNQKDKSGLSHCPTAYGLGQWDSRYLPFDPSPNSRSIVVVPASFKPPSSLLLGSPHLGRRRHRQSGDNQRHQRDHLPEDR
jgi:hypothetical protein